MNLYTYLTSNSSTIKVLFNNGIISTKTINDMAIYKYYLDVLEDNSRSMAVLLTQRYFSLSIRKVYLVLSTMEAPV